MNWSSSAHRNKFPNSPTVFGTVTEADGSGTWSLSTLRGALRQADDGLPEVSTYTIWKVLREAGFSWQRSRSWCETGRVKRKRKSGEVVEVTDPDAEAKKFDRTSV